MNAYSPIEPAKTRRPTMKELVQQHVVGCHPANFHKWLARQGWNVRDQSVAKTALSTYFEEKLRTQFGVWFTDPTLVNIGAKEDLTLQIKVPAWAVQWINSFPASSYARVR